MGFDCGHGVPNDSRLCGRVRLCGRRVFLLPRLVRLAGVHLEYKLNQVPPGGSARKIGTSPCGSRSPLSRAIRSDVSSRSIRSRNQTAAPEKQKCRAFRATLHGATVVDRRMQCDGDLRVGFSNPPGARVRTRAKCGTPRVYSARVILTFCPARFSIAFNAEAIPLSMAARASPSARLFVAR